MRFSIKRPLSVTVIRSELGMTLVEVLASLGLLMILLGVLSQFLYTDVLLWGKKNLAFERSYQLRLLSQTLNNDLGSLVGSTFLAEPAFQGNDYQLTFWSTKDNGLVQIQYRFSSSEEKVFRSVGFWGGKPQEVVLLNKVKEWKFEYFRSKTKNWDLLWQPTQKTEIPSLVRVNVSSGKNIAALIIPIKIRLDESGVND
ncbi:MAG TPA: hypothetical protein VHY08_07220 [Bacillota bacterium]|nr:hypothetical protein [Bacillota bacterium]